MGEVADMMLKGILCAQCGAVLDDVLEEDFEEPGYPRYCSKQCVEDAGAPWFGDD